jgi:hypothetical protein
MTAIKKAPDGSFCLFKFKSKEKGRFIYLGKETLDLGMIRIPKELQGKRFKIKVEVVRNEDIWKKRFFA